MGWSNVGAAVLEAATVIIQTGAAGSGIFVYNGTPAAGNLIGSWTASAGTDSFGNAYPGGFNIGPGQGSTGSIQITPVPSDTGTGAIVNFMTGSVIEALPASLESQVVNGGQTLSLTLNGALVTGVGASQIQPNIELNSEGTVGNRGSTISLFVFDQGDVNEFLVLIDGASQTIKLFGPTSTFYGAIVADTWQVPTLGAGWATAASSGSFLPVKYRIDAEDNLIIVGTAHTTSTTPAATIFTLDANRRPRSIQRVPINFQVSTTVTPDLLTIDTTGAVSLITNPTVANANVYFHVRVPLGNIS